MKKSFNELTDEAITNIRQDREETKNLLNDLIAYLGKDPENHKAVGFTIAKYLETLQRSNEQLVKIVSLVKRQDNESGEINEDDRNSIFDELNDAIKPVVEPKKKKK